MSRYKFVAVLSISMLLTWLLYFFYSAPDGPNAKEALPLLENSASDANEPIVDIPQKLAITLATNRSGSVAAKPHAKFLTSLDAQFAEEPGVQYKVDTLAADYEKLAEQAQAGDAIAARTLARRLRLCEAEPRDQYELMELERKTRAGINGLSTEPDHGEASLFAAREIRRRCGNLTPEQYSAREKWTLKLANLGDSGAQLVVIKGDFLRQFGWRKDSVALSNQTASVLESFKQSLLQHGYAEAYIAEYSRWTARDRYYPNITLSDQYANLWAAYQTDRIRLNPEYSWINRWLQSTETQLGVEQIAQARIRAAALSNAVKKS